jgi:hypothetical protein
VSAATKARNAARALLTKTGALKGGSGLLATLDVLTGGALKGGSGTLTAQTAFGLQLGAIMSNGVSGSYSFGSGTGLLPASIQLALAKAKGTATNTDDIKATRTALTYLAGLPKAFQNSLQVVIEKSNLEKSLAGLTKAVTTNTSALQANESQFLSSFAGDVTDYAPNAYAPGALTELKRTNAHLHAIKTDQRQTAKTLKKAVTAGKFPASRLAMHSLEGAFG